MVGNGAIRALATPLGLPEHPDQHRPVLLAVDQQLGEHPARRAGPELADSLCSFEVGEHQDVEQLGSGSRPEGVQALTQSALKLVGSHPSAGLNAEWVHSRGSISPGGDGQLVVPGRSHTATPVTTAAPSRQA